MMRRKWALASLFLLIIAGGAMIALHWRESVTVSYLYASARPVESTEPISWPAGGVNVNTANYEELDTLDGINSAQILALLDDRGLYGEFDFPEDLIYVKGIGEKTLAKIYDQLDFIWRENGN